MKIDLIRITQEPLVLSEKIDTAEWDIDRFDVKITGPIDVEAEFVKVGKEILVNVKLKVSKHIVCSRCADERDIVTEQDFLLSYNSTECVNFIDIDEDIRDQLVLDMPLKVLCQDGCKGLCPNCGQNLNESKCTC